MMLVPKKRFDLFDDFFDDEIFSRKQPSLMKTDIREKKDKYIIDIDLPGFEKENISLSLKDGYLEVSAKTEKETKNDDERIVRQERFFGECSRSFYVGEEVKEDDVNAEFKNGILKIEVPKKDEEPKQEETKQIQIK